MIKLLPGVSFLNAEESRTHNPLRCKLLSDQLEPEEVQVLYTSCTHSQRGKHESWRGFVI